MAEFFLILSIHFHFEERNELESLIKRELPVSPAIKSLTVQRLKDREKLKLFFILCVKVFNPDKKTIFTQKLYSQDKLVKLAISVPPTQRLSLEHKGYIPLDAVTQLLKTRQFSSNKIQVAQWIEQQVRLSVFLDL